MTMIMSIMCDKSFVPQHIFVQRKYIKRVLLFIYLIFLPTNQSISFG